MDKSCLLDQQDLRVSPRLAVSVHVTHTDIAAAVPDIAKQRQPLFITVLED